MANDNTSYNPKKWAGLDKRGKFLCPLGSPYVAATEQMARECKATTKRQQSKK